MEKKEQKTILQKIFEARKIIKASKMKKEGKNSYSNYSYFTPEQVEQLVWLACEKVNLMTFFQLKRENENYIGELLVIDLDSEDNMIFTMPTAIPDIKAANVAQQLGGCVTYTERYLKMSVFGIVENSLDFDSQEPEQPQQPQQPKKEELTPNHPKWNDAKKALQEGAVTLGQIKQHYLLSEKNQLLLIKNK